MSSVQSYEKEWSFGKHKISQKQKIVKFEKLSTSKKCIFLMR